MSDQRQTREQDVADFTGSRAWLAGAVTTEGRRGMAEQLPVRDRAPRLGTAEPEQSAACRALTAAPREVLRFFESL